MILAFLASCFGNVIERTPLEYSDLTLSASTESGSRRERLNEPLLRSRKRYPYSFVSDSVLDSASILRTPMLFT